MAGVRCFGCGTEFGFFKREVAIQPPLSFFLVPFFYTCDFIQFMFLGIVTYFPQICSKTIFFPQHACMHCRMLFCSGCTSHSLLLRNSGPKKNKVCDQCFKKLSSRYVYLNFESEDKYFWSCGCVCFEVLVFEVLGLNFQDTLCVHVWHSRAQTMTSSVVLVSWLDLHLVFRTYQEPQMHKHLSPFLEYSSVERKYDHSCNLQSTKMNFQVQDSS